MLGRLLELFRKLILTSFIFLIPFQYALVRLITAILVALAHLVLLLSASPYRQTTTTLVALSTSFSLLCTLFAALLVRLFDEIDFLRATFNLNEIGTNPLPGNDGILKLTVIILCFNFSVLAIAAAFIFVEGRNVKTLRVRSHGRSPTLSLAADKRYHLFISHGCQNMVVAIKQQLQFLLPGVRIYLEYAAV